MATETADPRTGLLAGVAVAALISLVGIRYGLQSYYLSVSEAEQLHKIGSVQSYILTSLRESEEQRLSGINEAMTRVATGVRPGFVAPAPSTDYAALQGWLQRPVNLHPPAAPPVAAPPAPTPPVVPSAAVPEGAVPLLVGGGPGGPALVGAPGVAPPASPPVGAAIAAPGHVAAPQAVVMPRSLAAPANEAPRAPAPAVDEAHPAAPGVAAH